jgi:hypothetical protein
MPFIPDEYDGTGGKDASEEPVPALIQNAAEAHELFTAYAHVGFTRDEALKIVIAITLENMRFNLNRRAAEQERGND